MRSLAGLETADGQRTTGPRGAPGPEGFFFAPASGVAQVWASRVTLRCAQVPPPCPGDHPEHTDASQQEASGFRDGGGEEAVSGAVRIVVESHDLAGGIDSIGN